MSDSDKHCCKLCGAMTLPIFAYPHTIPEVIPFKIDSGDGWIDVQIRVCPRCGYIQGEIDD